LGSGLSGSEGLGGVGGVGVLRLRPAAPDFAQDDPFCLGLSEEVFWDEGKREKLDWGMCLLIAMLRCLCRWTGRLPMR
jgi:hypothetical protein